MATRRWCTGKRGERLFTGNGKREAALTNKARKGTWRMPWLREAMKDVISCDKLRLGANGL